MKNKITIFVFTALLILLGVFAFLYFFEKNNRIDAENKFSKEKKEYLRKLSDSLNKTFILKTSDFEIEIDSLINLEKKIKYIPYEKTIYIDRTLDEALDVFSKHSANKKSASSN